MDKDKIKLYGAIGVLVLAVGFIGWYLLPKGGSGDATDATSGGVGVTESTDQEPEDTATGGVPLEQQPRERVVGGSAL